MSRGARPSSWKRYEAAQFRLASSVMPKRPVGLREKKDRIPQISTITTAANSIRIVAVNPVK